MNKTLKMLPLYLMLIAGALTSIITYILQYEGKTALLILLGVLLLFYTIGLLFQKMICRFEEELDKKEKERLEEGKVVEKSVEQSEEKDAGNGTRNVGEQ